jgi:hypothetical protein
MVHKDEPDMYWKFNCSLDSINESILQSWNVGGGGDTMDINISLPHLCCFNMR